MAVRAEDLAYKLRIMAGRAMTLYERMEQDGPPGDGSASDIDGLLEQWCSTAAKGDQDVFARRLKWAGWDVEKVRGIVADRVWPEDAPLPSWADVIGGWLEREESEISNLKFEMKEAHGPRENTEPVAFEELLSPMVAWARARCESLTSLLSDKAIDCAEQYLLSSLSHASERVLYREFSLLRATSLSSLDRVFMTEESREVYDEFVHQMLDGGLVDLFQEYSMLARVLGTIVEQWMDEVRTLCCRLSQDIQDIGSTFNQGRDPGKVCDLEMGLSDRHAGGKTVCRVTFESGLDLIYKPRDVGMEAAFYELVEWIRNSPPPAEGEDEGGGGKIPPIPTFPLKGGRRPVETAPDLKAAKVLSRPTLNPQTSNLKPSSPSYGWVECIRREDCRDMSEAELYFERAGGLMAVMYLLGGTDLHRGNIMASGAYPVPIDLETLFSPRLRIVGEGWEHIEVDALAGEILSDTVLRTGLLPHWMNRKDGEVMDVGGLAGEAGTPGKNKVRSWKAINSDLMEPCWTEVDVDRPDNVPVLEGRGLDGKDFVETICQGFRRVWDSFQESPPPRRGRIKVGGSEFPPSQPSPSRGEGYSGEDCLSLFSNLPIRFIFRPTLVYQAVMERSLAPEFMKTGLTCSIEWDALARGFLGGTEKPYFWPLLGEEHKAFARGDVPRFVTTTTSVNLWSTEVSISTPPSPSPPSRRRGDANQTENSSLLPAGGETTERWGWRRGVTVGVLDGYFLESGMDGALRRLRGMDSAGLEDQVGIVRAMYGGGSEEDGEISNLIFEIQEARVKDTPSPSPSPARGEGILVKERAKDIGANLLKRAILGRDGSATWVALQERDFQPVNMHLYSGCLGVGFFLAALAKVTGSSEFKDLALASVQRISQGLRKRPERLARDWGLGAGGGLGGVVYGLWKMSSWLDHPELLEDALIAASLVTQERIDADKDTDLLFGAAGAVVSLVGLWEKTGCESVLQGAMDCGQRILEKRIAGPKAGAAWPDREGCLRTGAAHGAAGIAYALTRLYGATGREEFLEAGKQGIEFERRECFFPPSQPSPSRGEGMMETTAWCRGASGIGLMRLACLNVLGQDEVLQEIEDNLMIVCGADLAPSDHLCCGNAGEISFLFEAGKRLRRPALVELAKKRLARVLARADQAGGFSLPERATGRFTNPTLFRGLAGIGYLLLQLSEPGDIIVTSVIMWD